MRFARSLRFGISVVLALAVVRVVVLVGTVWRERETARRVAALRRHANIGRERTVTAADLDGLPAPVRAYLEHALVEGQPYIDAVHLQQDGKLRLGDASSSWCSVTTTQHVTVEPPGFLWDAAVDLAPLVSLRIRDHLQNGSGSGGLSLFGVVPLDAAGPSPELNEAQLTRFLAEAVLYPTALLPSDGVQWEAVDERTAIATIDTGTVSASLTFSFNEDNEVTRVYTAGRHRRVEDGFERTPWSGYWHEYQTLHGRRIPVQGDVVWHLPDGDLTAWQGRITSISYDE